MIEFEGKVLNVDESKIGKMLLDEGAKLNGEFFFRRYVFDAIPPKRGRWLRLRTDGTTSTLTFKQIDSDEIDGTTEWEVVISDFDTTYEILSQLGLVATAYQENKRLEYEFRGVLVAIDSWPMIPTYIEVEGESKEQVMSVFAELGFDESDVTGKNTDKIYEDYGHDISKIDKLCFTSNGERSK